MILKLNSPIVAFPKKACLWECCQSGVSVCWHECWAAKQDLRCPCYYILTLYASSRVDEGHQSRWNGNYLRAKSDGMCSFNRFDSTLQFNLNIIASIILGFIIFQGLPSPEWKERDFGSRFNFSRVAGSCFLDRQLRKIGSMVESLKWSMIIDQLIFIHFWPKAKLKLSISLVQFRNLV